MRLIATDLDGTLLAPDGTIPAPCVDALTRATQEGVALAVATGRPVRWLDCLAPLAALHPYVIASNGAVVYDFAERRVLRASTIAPDAARALVERARAAVPGVSFGFERGDLFGLEPAAPDAHRHPGVITAPAEEVIARLGGVVKVLAYAPDPDSDVLAAAIGRAVAGLATVTTSIHGGAFGFAELSSPGITKAAALDALVADLGLSASEAVAFGDMPNDLDMLTWAGRAFVTADAHPDLRRRFPVVESCAVGGVGLAVQRLLDGTKR